MDSAGAMMSVALATVLGYDASGPGSAVEGSHIAGVFNIFCLCSVFLVYNLPYSLGIFFNTTSRS